MKGKNEMYELACFWLSQLSGNYAFYGAEFQKTSTSLHLTNGNVQKGNKIVEAWIFLHLPEIQLFIFGFNLVLTALNLHKHTHKIANILHQPEREKGKKGKQNEA